MSDPAYEPGSPEWIARREAEREAAEALHREEELNDIAQRLADAGLLGGGGGGGASTGLVLKGVYHKEDAYSEDEVVAYKNKLYRAKQDMEPFAGAPDGIGGGPNIDLNLGDWYGGPRVCPSYTEPFKSTEPYEVGPGASRWAFRYFDLAYNGTVKFVVPPETEGGTITGMFNVGGLSAPSVFDEQALTANGAKEFTYSLNPGRYVIGGDPLVPFYSEGGVSTWRKGKMSVVPVTNEFVSTPLWENLV